MASHDNAYTNADGSMILPQSLINDLALQDGSSSICSAAQPASASAPKLEVDTVLPTAFRPLTDTAASVSANSPGRTDNEALFLQLDDQARLIELQKQILMAQTAYDSATASGAEQSASVDFASLQYELKLAQMRLSRLVDSTSAAVSQIPTPPSSQPASAFQFASAAGADPQWSAAAAMYSSMSSSSSALPLHDRMPSNASSLVDEGLFLNLQIPKNQQQQQQQQPPATTASALSTDFTPLSESIWRRAPSSTSSTASSLLGPSSFGGFRSQQRMPLSNPSEMQSPFLQARLRAASPMLAPARTRHLSGSASPERDSQKQSDVSSSASSSLGQTGSVLSAHSLEFTPVLSRQQQQPQSQQQLQPQLQQQQQQQQQTYVTLTEPINYRHLLERAVNCDWSYIVSKIVHNNDQQASIFLQQKLKVGTPDQKYEIIEAIVEQAYPLMVNRFGNFLVQRCFEHGTPEQIEGIAGAVRGNVLTLAMDAFGCHVVQKALDCVEEKVKAEMVMELLSRVADTVVHRYACHVWQKLFELRWEGTPPVIMKYVNQELRGMWTQVALGETGSLVVQNIFENCVEEDKRPCIEEVLENIDIIARGQWGNWVVQHMIEQGTKADSERALDAVIQNAVAYSMDQYASKVIEKMLKHCSSEVVDCYLTKICEGRLERPRIPLIDIASDAHGNYLIQYILHNATKLQRDLVAAQIKKHMVSLRGSKWGSKCAWIVERYRSQQAQGHAHYSNSNSTGSGPGMMQQQSGGSSVNSYSGPSSSMSMSGNNSVSGNGGHYRHR